MRLASGEEYASDQYRFEGYDEGMKDGGKSGGPLDSFGLVKKCGTSDYDPKFSVAIRPE